VHEVEGLELPRLRHALREVLDAEAGDAAALRPGLMEREGIEENGMRQRNRKP